jgi:hypothetical protein
MHMKPLLAILLILALLTIGFAATIPLSACDHDDPSCLYEVCTRDIPPICYSNATATPQPTDPPEDVLVVIVTGTREPHAPPGTTIRIPRFSFHELIFIGH